MTFTSLRKTQTHSTHALVFGTPPWIAVATGNTHVKTSQEQRYDANHLYELLSS